MEKYTQEDILRLIKKKSDPNDTILILSGKIEGNLPNELWKLTHLKKLRLLNCGLKSISPEIKKLINLEDLNIEDSELTEFPFEVCKLENLKSLIISSSKINYIPKDIVYLTNLRQINLSKNEIELLPDEFSSLKTLEHVWLDNNNFEYFPEVLCLMPNLRTLYLNNNKITSIPSSITSLKKLNWLDLSDNNLLSLPKEFTSTLENADTVELDSNPFTNMPELMDKNSVAIFRYLESLDNVDIFSTTWEVPNSLSTAFQQYLNAFSDFVFGVKEVRIRFNAIKIDNGLQLTTEPTEAISLEEINELLEAYFNRSTQFEELKNITLQQKAKIDALTINWENDRNNFINKIQLLNSTNQMLAASVGNMSAIINLPQEVSFNTPLFNDSKLHSMHVGLGQNAINVNVSLQVGKIDSKNIDVSVGDNSNTNLVVGSPRSHVLVKINNHKEISDRANKIRETVEADESLSSPVKDQVIEVLAEMIVEANAGKSNYITYEKLLEVGSNISSIGSFVYGLKEFFK